MNTASAIPEIVRNYWDAITCPNCKQPTDAITRGWPCPHCNTKKRKPIAVVKKKPTESPKLNSIIYESNTRSGITHRVQCTTKGVFQSCSCEGYKYRKSCWHKDDFLFNKGRKGKLIKEKK